LLVVRGPLLDVDALRSQVAEAPNLPDHVVSWFRVARLPVDAYLAAAHAAMLAARAPQIDVEGVLPEVRVAHDARQSQFNAVGLGQPGCWFHLCGSLPVSSSRCGRDPVLATGQRTERPGIFDAAALRRRCREVVDVPPCVIRMCAGPAVRLLPLLCPHLPPRVAGRSWRQYTNG
jgi:hypothetical protein